MLSISFNLLVLLRLGTATVFGFMLGLERELTNKHAGLRTHILVCLGSAVFTLLSIYAFPMAVTDTNPAGFGDPARIAAQVLTGIGFIGGGTVLRHGSSVHGLTTAATLWVAAAIGMACGSGMILIGLITTVLSVGVLVLIRSFEVNVLTGSVKNFKRIKILLVCREKNVEDVHNYLIENFDYIHEITKEVDSLNGSIVNLKAVVDVERKNKIQALYSMFQGLSGINSISIQDVNE